MTSKSHFENYPAPPLYLSLWSIRYRMSEEPSETLELIRNWGIKKVEIAGFFNFEASDFYRMLLKNKLEVCSIVCPPISADRDFTFYAEWIEAYRNIFNTSTFILQSLPELFYHKEAGSHSMMCDKIGSLISSIANRFSTDNVKISYHCFPHDFLMIDEKSFFSFYFCDSQLHNNIGLQLDTYWLRMSRISPNQYSEVPIHSIHLNERDDNGQNCILGENKQRCFNYIKPLINRSSSIDWILENDSSSERAFANDSEMIQIVRSCINNWTNIWDSLKNIIIDEEIREEEKGLINTFDEGKESSKYIDYTEPNSKVFENELNFVLTEYLFGNESNLDKLNLDYSRLSCYVKDRVSSDKPRCDFFAEKNFFPLFWVYPNPGKQIIHVVGGAGSGKSTFIRFFFQYFLPYYQIIVKGADENSDISNIHLKSYNRHILLYVNLRRSISNDEIRAYLYDKLGESLLHEMKRKEIPNDYDPVHGFSESWVKRQISLLAGDCVNEERKWYISCILDNSDQMDESVQKNIINIIFDLIPEEPTITNSSAPVLDGERREIWRVIIPIRPENLSALEPDWNPIRNRETFHLDPVNHDLLVEYRAEFLYGQISNSTKYSFIDKYKIQVDESKKQKQRAYFDMTIPREKALEMKDSLKIAHGGNAVEFGIPETAKPIFDQLVNNSARRRLYLVRKIAFSSAFHERIRQQRLSTFYFFEGLLIGNRQIFDKDDPENLVLNLYDLGSSKGYDPHSIFVGIHSIYLLKNEIKDWENVKKNLLKIGYNNSDIEECERWLRRNELIKYFGKKWHVEFPIIDGHWALLQERAYTDNMAIACAHSWNSNGYAPKTNPLLHETLLTRFTASLWFINNIFIAEEKLRYYPNDPELQRNCGDFKTFSTTLKKLNIPLITHYVAAEYLEKISKLTTYGKTKSVISSDKTKWDENIVELTEIVEKTRNKTLQAHNI